MQRDQVDQSDARPDGDAGADLRLGDHLDPARMPGHWLLARVGKRVLRPGGLELTQQMLAALDIRPADAVVELAPGLGTTMQLVLARGPARYVGVERDETAAAAIRRQLTGDAYECVVGTAQATGLDDACATVVYGEALLTIQPEPRKAEIAREAYRVLRPGGRYGIHELALIDGTSDTDGAAVRDELSRVVRVGARPVTSQSWRALLEAAGFEVHVERHVPMRLLEPRRLVADEGVVGALRIAWNIARTPGARRRILAMRRVFRSHASRLGAVALVAVKPDHAALANEDADAAEVP